MKKFCLSFISIMMATVISAQENSTDAELPLDTANDVWYASPWVWVAGAALVIVLLVLLSRGKDTRP